MLIGVPDSRSVQIQLAVHGGRIEVVIARLQVNLLMNILFILCRALMDEEVKPASVVILNDIELEYLHDVLGKEVCHRASNFCSEIRNRSCLEYDEGKGALALAWVYVAAPKTGGFKGKILPSSLKDKISFMKNVFQKRKSSLISGIKTVGILRALEYFEGTADSIRNLMPREKINGESWA